MTKESNKAIMDRSKLKNKYLKLNSTDKFLDSKYAKQSISRIKKAKKQYSKKVSESDSANSKDF